MVYVWIDGDIAVAYQVKDLDRRTYKHDMDQ
jgi:hypothetical protein